MLTYPRFAKACYVFFAVAVLAAIFKLSISVAQPALLKMLPAVPTTSATEPSAKSPAGPEDPRLVSFSDDGAERQEVSPSRPDSRKAIHEKSGEGSEDAAGDASVFRRPSQDRGSSAGPVCGDLGDVPRSSRVVFPLPEHYFDSYDDTWGAARPQGGHEGSDLMSPAGTPEFAITDGRLVAVAGSNENGWNRLGGYTVMLEATYGIGPIKKGDLFYYAHLDRESSLPVGTEVRAGQKIGTAGDTGEGPEVTRGKFPPHLHLGWYDANLSEERSEARSGAMNPYPLLLWLERNGGAVSGGTDASYCQAPQDPNPAPSTGEPDWPTPSAPGQRPDLDTGSENASPKVRDGGPRRDGTEGDGGKEQRKDHEAGDRGQGSKKADKPEHALEEAMKPPPRKKIETKIDALLRDLPNPDLDRIPPGDVDGGEPSGEKGGNGRKDGDPDKGQGDDRQRPERPTGNRPEAQDAPPKETPKPPVPNRKPQPAPDRKPQPVPEGTDEVTPALEEPEAVTPPEAERERPAPKPYPLPSAVIGEPVGDGASPEEGAVPVEDEVLLERTGEAEPAVEPDEGE